MITKITFLKDYRTFKVNDCFEFKPTINLLVGDQGVGKSSLLGIIRDYSKYKDVAVIDTSRLIKTASLDFEKDNLRIKDSLPNNSGIFTFAAASTFSSHGQVNNAILSKLDKVDADVILMDEPDTALSIRSICKLVEKLKEVSSYKQVIASVHNPYLIQAFDEVLNLEVKTWQYSKDFIDSHLNNNENTNS